ncbi:acyltransferase family protein [Cellulomonas sp. McL0617]|uniref:acyltransferase family protein n=1 Tax=Cellulomonas sp. McL0617 TaxID=3415675 RepID=UPI003CE8EEBB
MRRIVGIDVARGLAVLGMMTAHVGPDDHGPVPPGGFSQLADGRPSALFVVLAGVSLALLSGGARPVAGPAMTRARARVVVRALLVLVLGVLLVALGTPVIVILPTYAVLFVAGSATLGWSRRALVVAAVAFAVLGPPLARWIAPDAPDQNTPLGLFVGPEYPALIWMSYLLTGLAVGRCDLRSRPLRRAGVLLGAGLVVIGHGGAWLAGHVSTWPTDLTTSAPHSSSTFEVVGNTGVAFLVIAASLAAGERWPRGVAPLAAVGALALTAYTVHIVVIAIVGDSVVYDPTVLGWLAFLGVTVVACWTWARFLGRGPLEQVMHEVSTRAADAPVG